mgnify:CR=1 FL=1
MVGARRFLVVFPVVFLISIFLGGIYIGKLFNFSYISMSFITFVFLLCIFILGMYAGRTWEAPFITRKNVWSIGIYVGDSPLNLTDCSEINNPVLTAKDVTDIQADFVADPFMIKKDDVWYMFMEVLNTKTQLGNIGLAVSKDGFKWNYKQIVIEEPFHMSYPYVLECDGEYYMIPETSETYSVRLYKADIFPTKWSLAGDILYGRSYKDSTIFRHNDMWWMFTSDRYDFLRLYYADNLMGAWTEHPESPVVRKQSGMARPGGRVVHLNGKIIRYAQEGKPERGFQIKAFEITELSTISYKERHIEGVSMLKADYNSRWISKGGHNIDPHQIDDGRWIACVDGLGEFIVFRFK